MKLLKVCSRTSLSSPTLLPPVVVSRIKFPRVLQNFVQIFFHFRRSTMRSTSKVCSKAFEEIHSGIFSKKPYLWELTFSSTITPWNRSENSSMNSPCDLLLSSSIFFYEFRIFIPSLSQFIPYTSIIRSYFKYFSDTSNDFVFPKISLISENFP